MERLTETVHHILSSRLKPGDVAIDATAGNGHDTLFLARAVGPTGQVYAFDVQPAAIDQTRRRLEAAGLNNANIKLLQRSHADLKDAIPAEHQGQIAAITFNLGYLPGGDKSFITQAETTRLALQAALLLLREEGVLAVVAYTGHPGGLEEAETVDALLQTLAETDFVVEIHPPPREQAPRLFVVVRRGKSA